MQPAFEENNIPIVLSVSDYYAPYASVVVRSIMDCASPENNYDILLMTKDMSQLNRETMQSMVRDVPNVSIRFVDMAPYLQNLVFATEAHFTIESFFRIFIPYIFEKFDKIIYCDSDLVWLHDPAELYSIDLCNDLIASVIDPIYIYNGKFLDPYWDRYNEDILHIPHDTPYVNTGVMLWNSADFRKLFSLPYVLQFTVDHQTLFCDQDVLNTLCCGAVHFLDPKWNNLADSTGRGEGLKVIFKEIKNGESYIEAREYPAVWHWADRIKPWNTDIVDRGFLFWVFARKSPFYESILFRRSYELYGEQIGAKGYMAQWYERI